MNKVVVLTLGLLILTIACIVAKQIKADSKTIVVPDDYFSIQDAMDRANVGDTVFVRSGFYSNQTLVINKTLSLVGEDCRTTFLEGPNLISANAGHVEDSKMGSLVLTSNKRAELTNWIIPSPSSIIILIYADNVLVSGFSISNAYSAGVYATGNGTRIIGNNFTNISGHGINVIGSHSAVYGNSFSWICIPAISVYGHFNNISGNQLVNQGTSGIDITGSYNIVSENSIIKGQCDYGINVYGSSNTVAKNNMTQAYMRGMGITLNNGSSNTVLGNIVTNYCWGGVSLCSSNNNSIIGNSLAKNRFGAFISGIGNSADNNTFFHNSFLQNEQLPDIWNTTALNFWDNGREGNFWSEYSGVDTNRDGIGDSTFPLCANNTDHFPLIEPFNVSSMSMSLPNWESSFLIPKPSPTSIMLPFENSTFNPTEIPTLGPTMTIKPTPSPSLPALAIIPTKTPSNPPTQQPTTSPNPTVIPSSYLGWIPYVITTLAIIILGSTIYSARHKEIKNTEKQK